VDITDDDARTWEAAEAAAMLAGDATALGDLWDDGFVVSNPANRVVSRAEVLDRVAARQIAYSSFARTPEAVRLLGDTVVVLGEEVVVPTASAPHAGQRVTRRYTHVWHRSRDRWRLAARQATIVQIG
jgi:ketosteroid isomerase-like protein